jgi:hypothetical protein
MYKTIMEIFWNILEKNIIIWNIMEYNVMHHYIAPKLNLNL